LGILLSSRTAGRGARAVPRGKLTYRGFMDRMLCTQCAAVLYSAAAKTLVERADPCPRCGGVLVLEPADEVALSAQGGQPPRA
jgi:phage FluMu protein Com